jgi:molybdopterin molybdotransferase
MISVEEALAKILNSVCVLDIEEKRFTECLGQVIAENIYSPFNIPLKDNSAMDGYATKKVSIAGATAENPAVLKVIGEIPAGADASGIRIKKGEAVRIMTGGVIPQGSDIVVPIEITDVGQRRTNNSKELKIGVLSDLPSGANIRKSGEDVARGELVLEKGKTLRSPEIGILASLGTSTVKVFRRPVVAILATGNEVVDVDQELTPGKLYNSNSYSIAAQVAESGGFPYILGIAGDNMKELSDAVKNAIDSDMLITTGGVSVGDYDMVKNIMTRKGKLDFWRVRMKPGKPVTFGSIKIGKRILPHLGLPGNPVSCMIAFELFGRPAVYKMMGRDDFARRSLTAEIQEQVINTDERRIFARVMVTRKKDKYFANLTGPQGSAMMTSMVKANGLAIVPETKKSVEKGDKVQVIMLDNEI